MQYGEIVFGTFVSRPNRFVAQVLLDDPAPDAAAAAGAGAGSRATGAAAAAEPVTVHVKNTGRCRELLVPGCKVVLERAANPNRKTPYDLVGVYKVTPEHPEGRLFNIDSQAPNKVVAEWLADQGYDLVKPEHRFGDSRVDFYMERTVDGRLQRCLLEVKGCTLEVDGVGYFPDAPTERGVKHLRELTAAQQQGYECTVAFVIQMEGVSDVRPNVATHPEFGQALDQARAAGVRILPLMCQVRPDSLRIVEAGE
ncbi:MAG: DNA/RNA nuclease SfsA [Coriobacteriia bacterium]|nr:DNA/RNA nuclease SfsA [Coriobacteriia bacterium]